MGYLEEIKQMAVDTSSDDQQHIRDLRKYIITQSQLHVEPIPSQKLLIGGWMPEDSFGMVYANRGVGKSWFCMALAVAIAEGRSSFLGWQINSQQNVLYIDGEMAKIELKERFDTLCSKPLDNLFIMPSETLYRDGNPIALDDKAEQFAIDKMLQELDEAGNRAQVIVLDNLSTLRRGVNENDNTETQDLITWLVSLRHRGYTVMIVHHSGKSGQQRGASIIEVPMDYVIKLSAPEKNAPIFGDGARFGVKFEKVRKKMPKHNDFTALLRPDENDRLQLYYDQHDEKIDDYFFVLRVIGKEGDISQRQIAKTLGLSVGKVNGAIKRLAKDGLINNSRDCKLPTTFGRKTLHEIWPDLFTPPAQSELEADDGVPF